MIAFPAIILTDCKKEEDPLSNEYTVTITYEYTKGFPQFSVMSVLNVSVNKEGDLTSGTFEDDSFDAEEVKYEDGKPALKIHMWGNISFDQATGYYEEIDGGDYLLVNVHSVIEGTMETYGWDEDLGFILLNTQDFRYEDEYSDGTVQFNVDDAVLNGSSIKTTLPDIQGNTVSGYTLRLTPSLNP